jgi:ribulose-5-phosphate 4-epimerase/fuculose-1-phosphate aldolase
MDSLDPATSHMFRPQARADGVRDRVTSAEWQARVELAALYRLCAHFGLTDTIYTHISLRVPGESDRFLINPFGLLYDEVVASSLVKIDHDGAVLDDPTGLGINRAGFVIHGAIHDARPDIACVLHTHSVAGIAVSAQAEGLLPISQHAAIVLAMTGYHAFEGVAINLAEQQSLRRDLGDNRILILRNHGLLTAGRTAAEALVLMLTLERACAAQLAALAGGRPLTPMPDAALVATERMIGSFDGTYQRDWAALLRLVERVAPDYRD